MSRSSRIDLLRRVEDIGCNSLDVHKQQISSSTRQWRIAGGISGCSRLVRTAGQGEAFDGVVAIV